MCHVHLGMPKIGQDNPTFSKQLPALPGCFDVPHPGMGRAEETPPELGRKGKRRHCPGTPLARWDRVGSCRIPGRTVGWLDQLLRGAARAMSGVPAGGEWATSAPSAATHCGGWDHRDAPGPSAPPPQSDTSPSALSLSPRAAPAVPAQPYLPGGVGSGGALVGNAGR